MNTKAKCIHYWIIEFPDGTESKGQCSKCGEVRMFPNYICDVKYNRPQSAYTGWPIKKANRKEAGAD